MAFTNMSFLAFRVVLGRLRLYPPYDRNPPTGKRAYGGRYPTACSFAAVRKAKSESSLLKKICSTLFIDASREHKSGKNQNLLTPGYIEKIAATYRTRKGVDKYAYLATFEDIKENDFNLNIPRFEEEEETDLLAVRKEREALKAQLAAIETGMDGYIKELGYQ